MSEKNFMNCPLECGARIKTFGKHIKKCKNYILLGSKFILCEYNNAHIIKNELYPLHLLSCKSKKKFEEDINDNSIDDNLSNKFNDDSDNEKKEENTKEKNKESNEIKNNIENKIENEETNIYRKKRRYRHEKALFKDESEIDQESLDFFKKVYK